MTPEQIEKHRRRFEELEVKAGNSIARYDDCQWYWRSHQNNRWLGYLMHAENLEVEIPSAMDFLNFPLGSHNDLVDRLQSQGIKIKSRESAKPDKKSRCYCGRTEIEGDRGMCSDSECIPY